eukprot:6774687-Karenia_brevis.AAC.1
MRLTTVNSSGPGPLLKYLEEAKSDIVFAQEHHLPTEKLDEYSETLNRKGWGSILTPAIVKIEGYSCGTAIVFRRFANVRHCTVQDEQLDQMGGRLTQAIWKNRDVTDIDIMCGYLHTGEGLGARNAAILAEVSRYVSITGRPFVMGADWNMSVDMLARSRWLRSVNGIIVAGPASVGTCTSATPASNIDFFVIHASLRHLVHGAATSITASTKPHRPCSMTFISSSAEEKVPKWPQVKMDARRMIGPMTAPPDYSEVNLGIATAERSLQGSGRI